MPKDLSNLRRTDDRHTITRTVQGLRTFQISLNKLVLLSTQNFSQGRGHLTHAQADGSFSCHQNDWSLKLDLPEHMRCHNVHTCLMFLRSQCAHVSHVSQVKLYCIREGEEPGYPTPMLSSGNWKRLFSTALYQNAGIRSSLNTRSNAFEYGIPYGLAFQRWYILEDDFVDGGHAIREFWRSRGLEPPSR